MMNYKQTLYDMLIIVTQQAPPGAQAITFSPQDLCMPTQVAHEVATMGCLTPLSFAIVAEPELIERSWLTSQQSYCPSPSTVSRDVRRDLCYRLDKGLSLFYSMISIIYLSLLKWADIHVLYPDKVHLCINGWTHQMWISFIVWQFIGLLKGMYSPWYWISSSITIYFNQLLFKLKLSLSGLWRTFGLDSSLWMPHDHGIHNKVLFAMPLNKT